MRKIALLAALAGALFVSLFGLAGRADAMTFSTPAGVMNAAAAVDVAQPEQVYWRRGWGWRGGYGWRRPAYWGPRPYYYGYWRPAYPAYAYNPYGFYSPYWGWGWRRWWW